MSEILIGFIFAFLIIYREYLSQKEREASRTERQALMNEIMRLSSGAHVNFREQPQKEGVVDDIPPFTEEDQTSDEVFDHSIQEILKEKDTPEI